MRRVAITRSAEQLSHLVAEGQSRGIEVIPLPLTLTQHLAFDWPGNCAIDMVDWVFFTSANGVKAFLDRVEALGPALSGRTRYAAVGGKTAMVIEEYGLKVGFIPSESYGHMLFEEWLGRYVEDSKVVVYARGRQVNYDPAPIFAAKSIMYFPIICYETKPQTSADDAIQRLSVADSILFTAPSAVEAYADRFGRPLARPIAIGRSTATRMDQLGWRGIVTMKQSDIDTILEYV